MTMSSDEEQRFDIKDPRIPSRVKQNILLEKYLREKEFATKLRPYNIQDGTQDLPGPSTIDTSDSENEIEQRQETDSSSFDSGSSTSADDSGSDTSQSSNSERRHRSYSHKRDHHQHETVRHDRINRLHQPISDVSSEEDDSDSSTSSNDSQYRRTNKRRCVCRNEKVYRHH